MRPFPLLASVPFCSWLATMFFGMSTSAYAQETPIRLDVDADTAVSAPFLYGAGGEWGSARRGTDFYPETDLIWLDADTLIRQKTNGRKSLDDFCRAFHGGDPPSPAVKPYSMDDVVVGLNGVLPYDWRGFLTERISKVQPHAPLGGVEASGWKLVFTDRPNELIKQRETAWKTADFTCSFGLALSDAGGVADVVPESPAAKAGVSPGMKLLAVNGRKYSADVLKEALNAGKGGTAPLDLLAEDGEYYHTFRVDYQRGERYPHLERIDAAPDLMAEVIRARAK